MLNKNCNKVVAQKIVLSSFSVETHISPLEFDNYGFAGKKKIKTINIIHVGPFFSLNKKYGL